MSTPSQLVAPVAAPSRVPPEIERLFQGSLLMLIITGFVTLASTGKLDFLSVFFTSLALLFRAYLLFTGRNWRIEDRFATYIGVLYIVVYLADFFFISGSFVTASVHLVLFGMVMKLFSVQRERDHVYLAILAFLEVLSAAVLTVDTVFLVAFGVFTLTAVITFMTMEMRRSALAATGVAGSTASSTRGWDRLEIAVSKTGVAIVTGIALFGFGIFFALPRLSYGYLSRLTQQSGLVSGFSDNVTLGEIGRIQQSSQVAMHIKVEGDTTGAYQFKLRGTALVNFDGKRWSNPPHNVEVFQTASTGAYNLDTSLRRTPRELLAAARSKRHNLIHYRVMMEPIGTNVLFLITRPELLIGRFREIAVDVENNVQNLDNGRIASEYGGYSDLAEPTAQELREASGVMPAGMGRYLNADGLDPRIAELAQQVAGRAATPYAKAAALQRYLSSRYSYTLDLGTEKPADPIANFLFVRKRGHCEYFASSLAIMLRQVGVPSRIVTGFRGGEYNSVSGSYIIRGSDAHSWVEAYIPGAGWTTFDPTPAADPFVVTGWRRAELYLDAMREFWREWIVNYDFNHQQTLTVSTVARTRMNFDKARLWAARRYNRIMHWARHTNAAMEKDPQAAGTRAVLIAAGVLLLLNLRHIVRLVRRANIARNPRSAPQSAASIWYERMLRFAARKGFRHTPAQTPTEFAVSITDPSLRDAVSRFSTFYERARFGDSAEDAAALPELFREVQQSK